MYKGRVLMESEKRRICELYPGKTINELASEFKVSTRRIKQILVEAKVPVPKRGRAMSRKLTDEEKKMLAEFYETASMRELSKAFGVPLYTVREALKEKGVNIRPIGKTIKSVKLQNETSVRPLKKEEITMPMPSVSVSAVTNAKTFPAPLLNPMRQRTQTAPELPSVINDLLEVMQYAIYDQSEHPGEIEQVFELFESAVHSCITLANDILFKPSELGSGSHYAEYTRLSVAGILIRQINDAWSDDDILSRAIPAWRLRYIRQASTFIDVALEKTDREA